MESTRSASEKVQSKYGTFENSPSSAFYIDIDNQFDKDICCGNCREGRSWKSNDILEKGFIKYLIDQIEFLREEKNKNKYNHWSFIYVKKLSLRDEQIISYKNVQINKSSNKVDNETVFHNYSPQGPGFKINSNNLNGNIINIFDELNNSFTLKDEFKQPCNKAFIDHNSGSIIDFSIGPQFNTLICETNDRIKQIGGENNRVIYNSNKMNDNNNNNNSSEQRNDADFVDSKEHWDRSDDNYLCYPVIITRIRYQFRIFKMREMLPIITITVGLISTGIRINVIISVSKTKIAFFLILNVGFPFL